MTMRDRACNADSRNRLVAYATEATRTGNVIKQIEKKFLPGERQ
jgi:hypothetical protein